MHLPTRTSPDRHPSRSTPSGARSTASASPAGTALLRLVVGGAQIVLMGGWIVAVLFVLGPLYRAPGGWFLALAATLVGIGAAPVVTRRALVGTARAARSAGRPSRLRPTARSTRAPPERPVHQRPRE